MGQLIKVETPGDIAETRQYLTFTLTLAGEHFAVSTLSVKEIIEASSPAYRGGAGDRPWCALRRATDRGRRRTCIVILKVEHSDEQQVIGVLVNAVNEPEPTAD